MLDRRQFLTTASAGLAAFSSFASSRAFGGDLFAKLEKVPPLPDRPLLEKNEDDYWAQLRQQFLIPENEIYLNNPCA